MEATTDKLLKGYMYHVDAFATGLFTGNPACVCIVYSWPTDELMQMIAAENNLAETAFAKYISEGQYGLRWFTPEAEVRLCGHATLATAHVLFSEYQEVATSIKFETLSGILEVSKLGSQEYILDFPADEPKPFQNKVLVNMGFDIDKTFEGKDDVMVELSTQAEVEAFVPNSDLIFSIPKRGLIITAKGDDVHFVSRCFYPMVGILEDPATGSAHTLLTTYWARRLHRNSFNCLQLSVRVGTFRTVFKGDRVGLIGEAYTFKKSLLHDDIQIEFL
jgi:PhzF family phenazine biosynthesis protein